MTSTFACPYCNSLLPPLAEPPRSEKLPCPRCGLSVPAARWQVDPALASAHAAGTTLPPVPGTRTRGTLYLILGIMTVMAVLGLGYALITVKDRRSRDPQPQPEPIAFRRPLELSGLGYLPKGCQVVAGLHIAEMMDDKVKTGKQLLAEPRPELLDGVLKQIPRTTGLPIEQLDHVLAATSFDAHFPQLVLVVKTRPKYTQEKIVEAVHPSKTSQHEGKPLYEFSLKPMGDAMLWCVEDHTLLYVIRWTDEPTLEHLQGLSATSRPVAEVLPAPLQEVLAQRLPRYQYAWAAGQLDQINTLLNLLPVLVGTRPEVALLKEMQSFALGLEPVEGISHNGLKPSALTLTGHFHMKNAAAAAQLKTYLEGIHIEGARSQKAEAPPPEEKEQWLTWQVRSEVAAIRALMNPGREAKK